MAKNKDGNQQPQTPEQRAEWFATCSVEESQELADFHGDATAIRRDSR